MGSAAGADAEESRVGVGVVEGNAGLDPAVLVEDVCIESGVHAFAGTAGAEGAASAEESLEGCESVDVGGVDREGFEREVDVRKVGESWVCWRWEWWKRKEATGIVRRGVKVERL